MNKQHLTLSDRITIQIGLQKNQSITSIARTLGVAKSTVSREIKARRVLIVSKTTNPCAFRNTCTKSLPCSSNCFYKGKYCRATCGKCIDGCSDFTKETCSDYERAPFVCDNCIKRRKCSLEKMKYDAKSAQSKYETTLSESRKGISLSETELSNLNDFITPKLKKGMSVSSLCEIFRDEIQLSDTTIYSYIEKGLLEARNIDLRRKVSRPKRSKSGPVLHVDRHCHINRTYEDYMDYMQSYPDSVVAEMDSVILRKGGLCLLTIFFTNCDLQLMFLRERNTAASVGEIFKHLRNILGDENFKKLFQVVLTDRGSEFTDPTKIEVDTDTGEIQCRVFYCNPQNSNQKSRCERNHELIRYLIPKGKAKEDYTEDEIRLLMNHINSYPRKKWNWQAPIDLFTQIYGQEIAKLLSLQKIPTSSINLTPALIK